MWSKSSRWIIDGESLFTFLNVTFFSRGWARQKFWLFFFEAFIGLSVENKMTFIFLTHLGCKKLLRKIISQKITMIWQKLSQTDKHKFFDYFLYSKKKNLLKKFEESLLLHKLWFAAFNNSK
jgi:hypothetical protein